MEAVQGSGIIKDREGKERAVEFSYEVTYGPWEIVPRTIEITAQVHTEGGDLPESVAYSGWELEFRDDEEIVEIIVWMIENFVQDPPKDDDESPRIEAE